MITTMLIIVGLIYGFMAGIIFRDMMDELLPGGMWPIIGAFLLSVLWVLFLIWITINLFCETTQRWYLRFGGTIFEEKVIRHEE